MNGKERSTNKLSLYVVDHSRDRKGKNNKSTDKDRQDKDKDRQDRQFFRHMVKITLLLPVALGYFDLFCCSYIR